MKMKLITLAVKQVDDERNPADLNAIVAAVRTLGGYWYRIVAGADGELWVTCELPLHEYERKEV